MDGRLQSDTDEPIAITGLGLLTPIGRCPWTTLKSLLDSATTADRLASLPDDMDPTTLIRATGGVGIASHAAIDPAIDLGEAAGRQAMVEAGVEPGAAAAKSTGLYLGSSKGAIVSLIEPRSLAHREQCVLLSPHGFLAGEIQRRLGLGQVSAPVAACATSLVALSQAMNNVRAGRVERALVVAVEASLHPMFIHSYQRLGALAPTVPTKAHRAKPLDGQRSGFTLNECAAAVMIERQSAVDSSQRVWAVLGRSAVTTEPYDLIRAAPRFDAIRRAVEHVVPDGKPMALLQPHATGTIDNDERELDALALALGDRTRTTPIYASKGAIGHGLGASGLVNVVLGCLFGRVRRRPPMPWLTDPIESAFDLSSSEQAIEPGVQVCVAAGFGGHVGAVSFETL
jgi:3-oxoacyl-[acyl-carrier-protein] synthase II